MIIYHVFWYHYTKNKYIEGFLGNTTLYLQIHSIITTKVPKEREFNKRHKESPYACITLVLWGDWWMTEDCFS